jgi:LuxR family maltose regulon positive regulatory protein
MTVSDAQDLTTPTPLAAGRAALAEGRWRDAFEIVRAFVAREFKPDALELLGLTAWYVDDAEVALDAYDAAYRLYVDAGDQFGAARVGLWLVACHTTFRDQGNIAIGWHRRVYDGLDRRILSPELGWLRIREAELALQAPSAGIKKSYISGRKAQEIGKRTDDPDLQMLGLAIEGLALMAGGRLKEATERITQADEAITAGRYTHVFAVAMAYSMIVDAYERIRDYEHGDAWCARFSDYCIRWNLRYPLAICKTQKAGVLMARGQWAEAEAELAEAADELSTTRPGLLGRAFVRLGELRRRQGRLIEATTLFDRATGQIGTALGQAALALDRGNTTRAFHVVNRIRRWVLPENRAGRVSAQEVAVRASLALPDIAAASKAISETQKLADMIPTAPMRGSAIFMRGLLAHATGDLDAAVQAFLEAKKIFAEAGTPFEAVSASVELAYALAAAGHLSHAIAEADQAEAAAGALGAMPLVSRAVEGKKVWRERIARGDTAPLHDARTAAAGAAGEARSKGGMFSAGRAVKGFGAAANSRPAPKPKVVTTVSVRAASQALGLSTREYRVLKFLAEGKSIPEIAGLVRAREHAIDRDLANVMRKMNAPSRAAAVAAARERGLV